MKLEKGVQSIMDLFTLWFDYRIKGFILEVGFCASTDPEVLSSDYDDFSISFAKFLRTFF